MRFIGSLPKESVTYESSVSDAYPLNVVVLALVPKTNLPLRDGNALEATEGLIRGAVSSFRGGIFNVDHESVLETMIGVFDSVIYDNGFRVSGSILCPKWKARILAGDYSGVSVEGNVKGELSNPESINIYAISFLTKEKHPQGGACPSKDSEGNPVCNVKIVQNSNHPIEAAASNLEERNIDDSNKGDLKMTKKKENNDPKVDEPKVGESKVDEPKVDELKVDEAKVDEPKVGEPKVGEPKADEPKVDEPKVDEPKVDKAGTIKASLADEPQAVDKIDFWNLAKNELGISNKDEFRKLVNSASEVSLLKEKMTQIVKENEGLKSYKEEQTKKMLQDVYPPAVTKDIAAAFTEYTKDPIAFTQKYSEDAVKFAAAKVSSRFQGSAIESSDTEEAKKMQVRRAKRDKFLSSTGGPVV